jgi:Fic family protein
MQDTEDDMFTPKFSISNSLLANIKRINILILELNYRHFPQTVTMEFEATARAVSVYASTSIEGNPLPLTEVKKILKSTPQHIRDSEKEVLNYNQALSYLNQPDLRISLPLILEIHKRVSQGLLPAVDCGKLRKRSVVVNDPRTGNPVYLPPDVDDVKPLMGDLVDFVTDQRDRIDALILAGIFHKQMVIIHPFMDGNGRTTRLATKVLLAEMELNTFNLFSFENFYNQNVTRYFQTVGEFGNYYDLAAQVDFTPWLEYFTEGIIDELLRVQKLLPAAGLTPEAHLQPYHVKILETIRERGYITGRDYASFTERAKATRALDFKKLLDLGLIERKGRGRATYYILKG